MIFLGFWQFSAEGRLRPTILRFSKKVYFLRGSKRFRYHYMQEVVPCCAIFAKLQNSLIQPRTSQKKFSLFENVSHFVFIVWRSTDRQFFYSPIRTIRVFWVCYARGPDFRAGGKIVFWAVLARLCIWIE